MNDGVDLSNMDDRHKYEYVGRIETLLGEEGRIGNDLATIENIERSLDELRKRREGLRTRLKDAKSQFSRLYGSDALQEVIEDYRDRNR